MARGRVQRTPSADAFASGLDTVPIGHSTARRRRLAARGLRDLLFRPDPEALGHRNRLSNFTFFLLAAAGGSAASVVAVLLASWALISLALRRFRWRLAASDVPVVGAMLLFLGVIGVSNGYHALADGASALEAARLVGKLMLFSLPLFLVPRMRLSRFADTLPASFLGIAYGGMLLVPICVADYLVDGGRVAGFAGNSGPLSVTALLAAGWSALSLRRDRSRWHLLVGALGVFGGALAVVLSGMRGAWPALPVVLAIAASAQRHEIRHAWAGSSRGVRSAVVAVLTVVLLGTAIAVAPLVVHRIARMMSELALIVADADRGTSLNFRREMYEAAVQAIAVRPWFGYGDAAHWSAIAPYLDPDTFRGISYSHLHNVVLTVAVDAGLIGVAALALVVIAPLWTAWRARRTVGGAPRLAAAGILVVAFLVPGMTNIMFFHDILDAVWAFSVSVIAASVPAAGERRP